MVGAIASDLEVKEQDAHGLTYYASPAFPLEKVKMVFYRNFLHLLQLKIIIR